MDKLNEKYIKLKRILAAIIFINALFSLYIYHLSNKGNVSNLNKSIFKTYIETEGGSGNYTVYSSNVFPTEGYTLNTTLSTCTNGGSVSQESDYSITYIGYPGSCTLYFDVDNTSSIGGAATTILNLAGDADDTSIAIIEGTELAYDGTSDKNLRYVGYDPNNYIDIGDTSSLWRIIGVFNNIDDGTGKSETRLKIVRAESLGNYSWDTSISSINNGCGINQWGPSDSYEGADIMRELNGDYLNKSLSSDTNWYNGSDNRLTAIFNKSKILSLSAQELIGDTLWYTGASDNRTSKYFENITTSEIYQHERGTVTGKNCNSGTNCNDTVTRTTTWVGKIALPYVSDFGYATDGSDEVSREICLSTNLEDWYCDKEDGDEGFCTCSWPWIERFAKDKNDLTMFLNPAGLLDNSSNIISLEKEYHYIEEYEADDDYVTIPTAFLKANVVITGGTGTEDDPYIAALP